MDKVLIETRLKSFGYGIVTIIGLAVVSALSSPEILALITENFGNGTAGILVTLFVTEIVKHLRNLKVLKDAQLGGEGKAVTLI